MAGEDVFGPGNRFRRKKALRRRFPSPTGERSQGVEKDRVISTVDTDARHGHKTSAHGFDGYKGHVAIDPDSEIVTATVVTPGNVADGAAAEELLADVLTSATIEASATTDVSATIEASANTVEVFGDAAYGTADLVEHLEAAGVVANVKVQLPSAPDGHITQDKFAIDIAQGTVTCPAGKLVQLRLSKDGRSHAEFGKHCDACTLRDNCTTSKAGRKISVHPKFETLQKARKRQSDPEWKKLYRATRPKVERKLAHLMRRRHGGRRARVRGQVRVAQDFALLAASVNLARIAVLGIKVGG